MVLKEGSLQNDGMQRLVRHQRFHNILQQNTCFQWISKCSHTEALSGFIILEINRNAIDFVAFWGPLSTSVWLFASA
eukprot:6457397-Amphidinium_carterae.1